MRKEYFAAMTAAPAGAGGGTPLKLCARNDVNDLSPAAESAMSAIRPTTSPPPSSYAAPERPRRESRVAVQPVQLEREVEADRRRSLREELDAADERRPLADGDAAAPGVEQLVAQIGLLGEDALRVLQPIAPEVRRLVEPDHVDEQA